jgi:hypothetical protein
MLEAKGNLLLVSFDHRAMRYADTAISYKAQVVVISSRSVSRSVFSGSEAFRQKQAFSSQYCAE